MNGSTNSLRAFLLAAALLATACATVPPATPITDRTSVVGTWQGTGFAPGGGAATVTVTFRADGRYTFAQSWPGGGREGEGRWTLRSDGTVRAELTKASAPPDRVVSTVTLHEQGGTPMLRAVTDSGAVAEFTRVE